MLTYENEEYNVVQIFALYLQKLEFLIFTLSEYKLQHKSVQILAKYTAGQDFLFYLFSAFVNSEKNNILEE